MKNARKPCRDHVGVNCASWYRYRSLGSDFCRVSFLEHCIEGPDGQYTPPTWKFSQSHYCMPKLLTSDSDARKVLSTFLNRNFKNQYDPLSRIPIAAVMKRSRYREDPCLDNNKVLSTFELAYVTKQCRLWLAIRCVLHQNVARLSPTNHCISPFPITIWHYNRLVG